MSKFKIGDNVCVKRQGQWQAGTIIFISSDTVTNTNGFALYLVQFFNKFSPPSNYYKKESLNFLTPPNDLLKDMVNV